ncbi:Inositol 2-dehydrogenase/D-chiro-inositol 3-dehydrogenase [Raoultella terrigena]|uniref:Inositol 2-dehydrogenase/D-chiro-inositol 3-dehydrogenase n=1 Tax=Raoultella terrigena TaxID=577 RepID=A0A4U9D7U9_RAOTE|nr:Inositol 2-dehydrogenase/D-chiro-inositol 3-dehydrogenase [Raoultella terrigena]
MVKSISVAALRYYRGPRWWAVSDIQCRQRAGAVALPGVHAEVYADGHDVINASDVDAILVTSWDPTHEEFTLAAIAAGKPVFCEKPLAMSAEGCRRMSMPK